MVYLYKTLIYSQHKITEQPLLVHKSHMKVFEVLVIR